MGLFGHLKSPRKQHQRPHFRWGRALGCLIATVLSLTVSAAVDDAQIGFASNGQQLNNLVGRGVALADFDGDGALDAFVVNQSGSNGQDDRVYFGDGHGRFTDSGQRLEGPTAATQPVVFDIDGNGAKDVIVGWAVWMNDGRGRFAPDASRSLDAKGSGFWQCRLADLNGDGLTDLFAIVHANGQTEGRIYLSDKNGRLSYRGQAPLMGIVSAVGLGDVNGDGFMDAVLSGWRNASADPCPNRVLLGDGKGGFVDTGQLLDEGIRHSHGLALGDFDRDKDLDIVLVTQGSPSARLYLNDGKGRFTPGRTLGTTSVEKVAVADLNGDGSQDIFLACIGPDEVWVNDGQGGFTDSTLRLGTEWSWEIAVGDVNGDRLPDLFVVNLGIDRNAPPENMMKGRFADVWLNTSKGRPLSGLRSTERGRFGVRSRRR